VALTFATPDDVSGNIQGILLWILLPVYQKFLSYICVHAVESSKCENESATKRDESEPAGPLQAKQGIHSLLVNLNGSQLQY
jgi:hypothetical protein